jgi:uncharacterized pyridoxamine 5'-phosphate oxidase family protein
MKDLENTQQSYKKLKYSYNPEVTFELSKKAGGEQSYGWLLAETNWEENSLKEMVKTVSYLPSKLKDGHKLKKNVEEIYFLTLDFDNGDPSVKKYIEMSSSSKFSWFLHTTVNHQRSVSDEGIEIEKRDKYRVIIPLSRSITLDELGKIKEVMLERYPSLDKTCFDGNRYFKMNPNAETHLHNFEDDEGNLVFLNPDDLIPEKKKPGRPKKEEITISLDDEVMLDDGSSRIKVKDISRKTRIFCPFCDHSKRTHPHTHNAFIDINDAGQYYIFCSSEGITYWQDSSELDASKSKLFWNESVGGPSMIGYESYNGDGPLYIFKNNGDFENYCVQNAIDPNIRSYLPRREIIFNPGLHSGLNDEYYNIFEETEYMGKDYTTLPPLPLDQAVAELKNRCKVIYEILINIFGEKEYLERFMNWIAYILQEREKSYTAWLITSNVQGIGKDLIFIRILMPLFGDKQSQLMNGSRIAKNFNKIDMNCFLRGYNEVFSAGNVKENLHRKESLKDLITAPYQSIEIKGVDTFQTHNFMNFILFSNSQHPIFLDDEDRRFNVIRNDDAVKVSELSIYRGLKHLEPDIAKELSDFADIIFTLKFNRELANTPIETEAKNRLKSLSKDEYEEFAEKLKAKDSDYFLLEEIFPITKAEKDLGFKSDIAQEVIDMITMDGVIPARYMSKICKYHFHYHNYKSVLNRLKLKGIEEKTMRKTAITMKVYECK